MPICGQSSVDQEQLQKALALFTLCAGGLSQLIDEATERVCTEASADRNIETAVKGPAGCLGAKGESDYAFARARSCGEELD
jgi:hypothetical protein